MPWPFWEVVFERERVSPRTQNVKLGLQLIDYTATIHKNPTGINKKAALGEAKGHYDMAFQLYHGCPGPNALLLFNLGWCYVHGEGVEKNRLQGENLWKQAAAMAPEEGSEEAAWLLYLQYRRDQPKEARQWLQLAPDLGHDEALFERRGYNETIFLKGTSLLNILRKRHSKPQNWAVQGKRFPLLMVFQNIYAAACLGDEKPWLCNCRST
jgi:TPR repeat protein